MLKTKKWRTLEKVLKSTKQNGDNVLHFIIRLEQSETLTLETDIQDFLKEIKFIYDILGSNLFLKLLIQENNEGFSPLQEAKQSKGLAYKALQHYFFNDQTFTLKSSVLSVNSCYSFFILQSRLRKIRKLLSD